MLGMTFRFAQFLKLKHFPTSIAGGCLYKKQKALETAPLNIELSFAY